MPKIKYSVFTTALEALNRKQLTVSQIAKNAVISRTYLYRLFSKKNHPTSVTTRMAYRIGRGIGLTPQKSQNWSHKLVRHTRNPKLRKPKRPQTKARKSSKPKTALKATKRTTEPAYKKRQPVVKFCPVDTDQLSDLALHVKQLMSDKQISMKALCKRTFLNKQRLHDLFNGKQKTVDRLTAVRLADGLDIPTESLFTYNHYTPKIKTVVMSDDTSSDDVPKEPLNEQISKLNDKDTKLIQDMVNRLLIAEKHEGK